MSIHKEILELEKGLFKCLEDGFRFAFIRDYASLKITLDAMHQLEVDYKALTKTNFIKKENIDRLYTYLDKLKVTFDEDQKEWNELNKKFK